MTEDARLTWYPGSVLPYASLWHTVQRVVSLNRLRLAELPLRPGLGGAIARCRTMNLLHNDPGRIDTAALAHWLGEPVQAFRWSHLGEAAPWMRFLFTPGLRVCRACLGEGYHSALLSLRLLVTCPIHGLPLQARCECGHGLSPRLSPQRFMPIGGGHCSRLAFFTPETCRRPLLDARTPGPAFNPVARWLEQCSDVMRLQRKRPGMQAADDLRWLAAAQQWSQALDIEYPSSFVKDTSDTRLVVTVHRSGSINAAQQEDNTAAGSTAQDLSPAVAVHKAMSRHLRRHVLRQADAWVQRFMASADPLHIARRLAQARNARLSFAEMLWARAAEEGVEARRWPRRSVPAWAHRTPSERVLPEGLELVRRSQSPRVLGRLQEAGLRWLEAHAAALILLELWRQALDKADAASLTGLASWEARSCPVSDLCGGMATVERDGSLRFVALTRSSNHALVRPQADEPRHEDSVRTCRGPCLTWSKRGGWHVDESLSPGSTPCKRHRLFGLADTRPHFWIFTSGNGFVARHCTVPMQCLGATACEAITGLRAGMRLHARLHGPAISAQNRASPSARAPHGDESSPHDLYCRQLVHHLRGAGFWGMAGIAFALATRQLEHQVQGANSNTAAGSSREPPVSGGRHVGSNLVERWAEI